MSETAWEGVRHPTHEQIRTACEALKGVRAGNVTDLDPRFKDFIRVAHPASVLELLAENDAATHLITRLTEALEGLRLGNHCWCCTWVGGEHEPECEAAQAALAAVAKERAG